MGRRLGEYRIVGRRYHPNGTSTAIAVWYEREEPKRITLPLVPEAVDTNIPTARAVLRSRGRR